MRKQPLRPLSFSALAAWVSVPAVSTMFVEQYGNLVAHIADQVHDLGYVGLVRRRLSITARVQPSLLANDLARSVPRRPG
jgi:hypothetical protein